MEAIVGLIMGVGLSAACGFRVFVPLLVVGVGAHTGHVTLAPGFAWVGSTPALVALGVATVVEVLGYMVPWVDHLLDAAAVPLSVLAGTMLTWGLMGEISPALRWGLAAVAGGGTAGGTCGLMAALRGASTATTGGLGNPLFAAIESFLAIVTAVLAVLVPIVAIGMVAVVLLVSFRLLKRLVSRKGKKRVRTDDLTELEPI